jgi:anti-anti-sigma factor
LIRNGSASAPQSVPSLTSTDSLPATVTPESPILVGNFPDVVWVRVEGKGNFRNSPELKEFALHMLDSGRSEFVIDLEGCPMMDSTFMGTLTGIALRLKASLSGHLEIINANPRNQQLLQSLGLDQIFTVDIEGTSWKKERDLVKDNLQQPGTAPTLDQRDQAEFVLEAHEALCKANEENVRRFKDVIEFLKHDVDKQNP